MNLGQLRTRLRKLIGNVPVGQVPETDLTELLNDANIFLLDRYSHRNAKTSVALSTVASTATVALASDYSAIFKVWDTGVDRPLRQAVEQDLPGLEGLPEGRPTHYRHVGATIKLYPTPDAVYTLTALVKKATDTLTLDADVPTLDSSWHMGIVYRARYAYYDGIGDIPKAQYALNSFNEWLATKPTTIEDESFDQEAGTDVVVRRNEETLRQTSTGRIRDNNWMYPRYPE